MKSIRVLTSSVSGREASSIWRGSLGSAKLTTNIYRPKKIAMKSQDALVNLNLNKMLDWQGLRIFFCNEQDR